MNRCANLMNDDQTSTGSSTVPSRQSTGVSDGSPGLQQSTEQVKQSAQAEFQKLKGAAHDQTAAAVEQMKEKAQDATRQAKEMSSTFFQNQKQNVLQRVDAYAKSARTAADCLRAGEGAPVAGAVSTAADQLTRVSDYLRQKEPTDLVRDLEQFARRKPEVVFGGMFLLGLAASRFLKASAPRSRSDRGYGTDYHTSQSSGQFGSTPTYASGTGSSPEPYGAAGGASVEEPFATGQSGTTFTATGGSSTAPSL